MSAGQEQPSMARSAPRVVMSWPWIVVMVGVGLLVGLLLIALLSLRREERQAIPAPAPPVHLPTVGAAATSDPSTEAPLVAADVTTSPTVPSSVAPSPRVTSVQPSTSAAAPLMAQAPSAAPRDGVVTARYEAIASERNSFEARLTVTNDSGRSQDWAVQLQFAGNVKSLQASSAAGVSVSTSDGVFELRGTGPLASGQTITVQLQFKRMGSGDRPGSCTVNGTGCAFG
ncbi:cellulose binding domain-containing protein [Micromonospora sp. SL4-19]|uniref:cellulose binding domain-containing protein n=1 Tax=Micromonospora sp. SL4-19 TaxID=3399129 RepID=UPI003A4D846F